MDSVQVRNSPSTILQTGLQARSRTIGPTHRTPDHDPLARKAARAVASATSPDDGDICSAPTSTNAGSLSSGLVSHAGRVVTCRNLGRVSIAEYSAPPAPVVCPFPSDRRRPTLTVSLPRFATQDFALKPDTALPHSVATQLYPSSPGSRSSTPCYDLAEFDSKNSRQNPQCPTSCLWCL